MNLKKLFLASATGALILGIFATAVFAAPLVQNGSFEEGTERIDEYKLVQNEATIDNWTVVSGNIEIIGTYWDAYHESRSIDLSGSQAGAISQEITTIPGHDYQVQFYMAGNPEGTQGDKTMLVDVGGVPTLYVFNTAGKGNRDMGWVLKSFEFTADGPTTTLTFTSTVNTVFGPALDNVVVEEI